MSQFKVRTRGRVLVGAIVAIGAVALTVASAVGAGPGPQNTALPTLSGTAQQGQTLTTTNGTWTSATTITYAYRWQRCNADASGCADISGATNTTYMLGSADAGNVVRSVITATDVNGSNEAASAPTAAVVASSAVAPANTVLPAVTGTPTNGQTLTATTGTWAGAMPQTYAFAWLRCDAVGANCAAIPGAIAATYALTQSDAGKSLRVVVSGTNASGSGSAISVPTAVIAQGPPVSLVKLPDGTFSVAAADVKSPDRLVIDTFKIDAKTPIHSRNPFRVTVHVSDTNGYSVRGVLVYAIGLPYNRILDVPETATGQDGTISLTLKPTKLQPLKLGARVVLFLRARVQGDSLLAGVSTRRLVEVVFGA